MTGLWLLAITLLWTSSAKPDRTSCRSGAGRNSGQTPSAVWLLVVRRFEQWILVRTPDHLVQGGAGRNHRIHRVFLLHQEVDQEGARGSPRFLDGGFDFGPGANRPTGNPVGLG